MTTPKTAIFLIASHLFLLPTFALGAALPNPITDVSRQTSSTKLCDGDKINGALLNTFTPDNPPSAALIEQCTQVFAKTSKAEGNRATRGSTGTSAPVNSQMIPGRSFSCSATEYRARTLDIHIAILHILQQPDVAVSSTGSPVEIFRWGEASIFYIGIRRVDYISPVIWWRTHDIAYASAAALRNCYDGEPSNYIRRHTFYFYNYEEFSDVVEAGERHLPGIYL